MRISGAALLGESLGFAPMGLRGPAAVSLTKARTCFLQGRVPGLNIAEVSFQHAIQPVRGTGSLLGLKMADEGMIKKLESTKQQFDDLTQQLGDPELANNTDELLRVTKKRASLEPVVKSCPFPR